MRGVMAIFRYPDVNCTICGNASERTFTDKLQEEAKHYRPLAHGQVAVTSAKNLKAKSIYHISLPDYKLPGSERVRRPI